eukprot:s4539_g2.t2
MALYSADTSLVGMTHFTTLRAAVVFAFLGPCKFASPFLACFSLSSTLVDPLLYVILCAVRSIRRIASFDFQKACEIVTCASKFKGTRPYGPASSWSRYLQCIGWEIQGDGTLVGPDFFRVNVLHDPAPTIVSTMKKAWPHFLVANMTTKGVGEFMPHPSLTAKVFRSFNSTEQAILVRNMIGGFQTAGIQSRWDAETSPLCPLCGEEDSRSHRTLHCANLKQIRDKHAEAVDVLVDHRPEWNFIPLARAHPDQLLQHAFVATIPVRMECEVVQPETAVTFYTDGGALFPADPCARISSWAVVVDTTNVSIPDIQLMASHLGSNKLCPLFQFHVDEFSRLKSVLTYLVELNICRDELLKAVQSSCPPQNPNPQPVVQGLMPTDLMGSDALNFLRNFAPMGYSPCFVLDQIDQSCLHGILQGANFAWRVDKKINPFSGIMLRQKAALLRHCPSFITEATWHVGYVMWQLSFSDLVSWYLSSTGLEETHTNLLETVTNAIRGFHSFSCPPSAAATVASKVAPKFKAQFQQVDSTADWLVARASMVAPAPVTLAASTMGEDSHLRFIDSVDAARDSRRAVNLRYALHQCRKDARTGSPLEFRNLQQWQQIFMRGLDFDSYEGQRDIFRIHDAYAKHGRERYPLKGNTESTFKKLLAQANSSEPLALRAARAYLDVCFFHPFEDCNSRMARLVLDFLLTREGYTLGTVEPIFLPSGGGIILKDPFLFLQYWKA